MRIPASDLLLTTVDNATTTVAASDGEGSGDAFAQLLQGMPVDQDSNTSSATLTVAATRSQNATGTATAILSDTANVPVTADMPAIDIPATDIPAADSLIVATAIDTVMNGYPLTMTVAMPSDAEQSEAASSARMMSALRREFVPTPVLTSAVEVPKGKATPQKSQAEAAQQEAETTTTANQPRPTTNKSRTPALTSSTGKGSKTATPSSADTSLVPADTQDVMPNTGFEAVDSDDTTARASNAATGTAVEREPIEGEFSHESDESLQPPQLLPTDGRHARDVRTLAAAELPAPASNPSAATTSTPPTTSNKPAFAKGGNRGTALPLGGNDLPPANKATANATTDNSATFASLIEARTAPVTAFAANVDTANARTAAGDNSSTASTVLANATLASNVTGSLPLRRDSPALQLPPVFTSQYVMGTAGWSEETTQHIRWMRDDDMQSADIQLHPAELGRLDISIDFKDGQASVNLVAGSAEARELLEKAIPSLREMLAQSGMSLGSSNVAADHQGREARQSRFNSTPLPLAEPAVNELPQGRPALFRSYGGSNRIDYYV